MNRLRVPIAVKVRAAEARRPDLDDGLTVPGVGVWKLAYLDLTVAEKCHASHGFPPKRLSIECSPPGRRALFISPVQPTITRASQLWTHYTGKTTARLNQFTATRSHLRGWWDLG